MAHPQRISPEVELQVVKGELDIARKRIERYTHLVATLYDELDTLRNGICIPCKTKLVPGAASFWSAACGSSSVTPLLHGGFVGESGGIQQTNVTSGIHNAETPSSASRVNVEPTFVSPAILTTTVDKIADSPVPTEPNEDDWSVEHNHEAMQTLNVHLSHTFILKSKVYCVRFSREGKHLAMGLQFGKVYIYDLATLSKRVLSKNGSSAWAVQFSPDDKHLAVGRSRGRLEVWDIAEGQVLAVFNGHTDIVYSVDFTPDGHFLVSGSFDSVRIWSVFDRSSKELESDMAQTYYTSLSPDGRYVAAADVDGVLRIWNFHSGQLLAMWDGTREGLRLFFAIFTLDGNGLLSGGDDAALKFWDVSSLKIDPSASKNRIKKTLRFRGHTRSVLSAATLPDSRWVVSGSSDCSVRIWDIQTGTWQCTLNAHRKDVKTTDASSDGLHLASGSDDRSVRVWRYEQTG